MKTRFYPLLAILATVALLLSACNDPRAAAADIDYWPWNWGNRTLATSLEAGCVGGATETVVAGSTYPCPAPDGNRVEAPVAVAANPADLCAGLVNPVWSAVMARNDGMLQANYEAWVADVSARGGDVFDAATCVPAARLVHPGETIPGAGIFQLITVPAEGPDTWQNHGTFEYTVPTGCTLAAFGAQGDNPAALYGDRGTVQMEVFNSTGTSILATVTCR